VVRNLYVDSHEDIFQNRAENKPFTLEAVMKFAPR